MAGYSGTPLGKKLGIKKGSVIITLKAPVHYFDLLTPLPDEVKIEHSLRGGADLVHMFVHKFSDLKKDLIKCKGAIKQEGMIWVSWPKKSSGVVSDLDENMIRDFGLRSGLVDVKVCAVDEVWSGLKFVIPVTLRKRNQQSAGS